MNIGFVGLGKLGLPVALALEQAGHTIVGWDASQERRAAILQRDVPEAAHEPGVRDYLAASRLALTPKLSLAHPEVVLICVQTPHQAPFEGVTPLREPPQDFDYTFLRTAVGDLAGEVRRAPYWDPLVVVVSTCLPGTFDRELRALTEGVRVVYHPLFIAMGSVVEDFTEPEFVLIGSDEPADVDHELWRMYEPVHGAPIRNMSIVSAELTKVAYNAWIGYKLMLTNGIAMMCEAVGADCDQVMDVIKLATKRLVSPAYMHPGLGDSGGCHPRDQIALSWLARSRGLAHDPFAVVIEARERHAEWLAWSWIGAAQARDLPMIMLGEAYKPNSTLTTGSHARLIAHYAREAGFAVRVEDRPFDDWPVACYFFAIPHDYFLEARPPAGSVVVDPWGLFPVRRGVELVTPGRARGRAVRAARSFGARSS